ncbi:MAG TPA: response regulator transcription factor [Terriglobia bacterium]|nr:response regulator transcription factor [Terriglobia bacterium]
MGWTILIVDDHEIVRKGIRDIIRQLRPEWTICGEAGNGAEAVEMGRALNPDVVILDIAMPGMSGIEAASQLAKSNLASRLLLFTMYESNRLAEAARDAGAQGYVLKSQAAHHLVLAIDRIMEGGTFFGSPEANGTPNGSASSDRGPVLCKDLDRSGACLPLIKSFELFLSLGPAARL